VATEHGVVLRALTKDQYEEAVMAEARMVALAIGGVAMGLAVAASLTTPTRAA
jgi:hypothetical protein